MLRREPTVIAPCLDNELKEYEEFSKQREEHRKRVLERGVDRVSSIIEQDRVKVLGSQFGFSSNEGRFECSPSHKGIGDYEVGSASNREFMITPPGKK